LETTNIDFLTIASTVQVWSASSAGVRTNIEDTVMTYGIKQRINSEPFIDRTAALHLGETRISDKGDKRNRFTDWKDECTLLKTVILTKKV